MARMCHRCKKEFTGYFCPNHRTRKKRTRRAASGGTGKKWTRDRIASILSFSASTDVPTAHPGDERSET